MSRRLTGKRPVAFGTTGGLYRDHLFEYRSWASMRHRCLSPDHKSFARYGGAGVTCCARWERFAVFLADMGPRPADHTLDRYSAHWRPGDGPLPYSPATCRWATAQEQNNNLSTNRVLVSGEERGSVAQWSRRTGISQGAIQARLRLGWSEERALTEPVEARRPMTQSDAIGIVDSLRRGDSVSAISRDTGFSRGRVRKVKAALPVMSSADYDDAIRVILLELGP